MERKELFKIIDVLKEQINDAINMRQEEIRGANFALTRLKLLIPKDSKSSCAGVMPKIAGMVREVKNDYQKRDKPNTYYEDDMYSHLSASVVREVLNIVKWHDSNFSE